MSFPIILKPITIIFIAYSVVAYLFRDDFFAKSMKTGAIYCLLSGMVFLGCYFLKETFVLLFCLKPLEPKKLPGGYFERKELQSKLTSFIKTNSQAVFIVGPSGAGKSTLSYEVARNLSKSEKVLYYKAKVKVFETILMDQLFTPLVTKILSLMLGKKESIFMMWKQLVYNVAKYDNRPLYIFIDEINVLLNDLASDSDKDLLQELLSMSKECFDTDCYFIFISSDHGSNKMQVLPNYLKEYRTITVRELSEEQAKSYLEFRQVPSHLHKQILEICGTIFNDLKNAVAIYNDISIDAIKESMEDRITREYLGAVGNDPILRKILFEKVKNIDSKGIPEIEFKKGFSKEEFERIIRTNIFFLDRTGVIFIPSKAYANFVFSPIYHINLLQDQLIKSECTIHH